MIRIRRISPSAWAVGALLAAWPASLAAQELEPHSYSAAPVGASAAVVGYGASSGEILFDAAAPVSDVQASISAVTLGYSQVFDLVGRQSSVTVFVPYVRGEASGVIGGAQQSITRSGLGDTHLKLTVMLWGGPALTPQAFAARPATPIVGVSVHLVAPTGQYVAGRAVNVGANRWAIKPEIAFSYPIGRWQFEGYAGVWLFSDNDDYLGGRRRSQEALATLQAHVSYTMRPRLWIAADATYFTGGQTTVEGLPSPDRQDNVRIGVTLSLPVVRSQSVRVSYGQGLVTRLGNDFTTVAVTWQYGWLQ